MFSLIWEAGGKQNKAENQGLESKRGPLWKGERKRGREEGG
jgi:hypothetical protein